MTGLKLVVTLVSVGFLAGVMGVVSYLAFAGPSRDLVAPDEDDASTAD